MDSKSILRKNSIFVLFVIGSIIAVFHFCNNRPSRLYERYINTPGYKPANLSGFAHDTVVGLSFHFEEKLFNSIKEMKGMHLIGYEGDDRDAKESRQVLQENFKKHLYPRLRANSWPKTISSDKIYIVEPSEGIAEYLFEQESSVYYLRMDFRH